MTICTASSAPALFLHDGVTLLFPIRANLLCSILLATEKLFFCFIPVLFSHRDDILLENQAGLGWGK